MVSNYRTVQLCDYVILCTSLEGRTRPDDSESGASPELNSKTSVAPSINLLLTGAGAGAGRPQFRGDVTFSGVFLFFACLCLSLFVSRPLGSNLGLRTSGSLLMVWTFEDLE